MGGGRGEGVGGEERLSESNVGGEEELEGARRKKGGFERWSEEREWMKEEREPEENERRNIAGRRTRGGIEQARRRIRRGEGWST